MLQACSTAFASSERSNPARWPCRHLVKHQTSHLSVVTDVFSEKYNTTSWYLHCKFKNKKQRNPNPKLSADGGKISTNIPISVSVTQQKQRFAVEGGHRRTCLVPVLSPGYKLSMEPNHKSLSQGWCSLCTARANHLNFGVTGAQLMI